MKAHHSQPEANTETQALIVQFNYELPSEDAFFDLDETLREAFFQFAPAMYDGHEIAMNLSDGMFFFYGPDADELLRLASPILLKYNFMKGAECNRRYGNVENEEALKITTLLGQLPS
jgi:hypothetical protein